MNAEQVVNELTKIATQHNKATGAVEERVNHLEANVVSNVGLRPEIAQLKDVGGSISQLAEMITRTPAPAPIVNQPPATPGPVAQPK